jgi:hypothetical protein
MRRLSLLLLSLAGILLLAAPAASAHILKQDNGVYAEMHIEPDDHPRAGEVTKISFEFGANQGVFQLADCDCRVIVTENGRIAQTVHLQSAGLENKNQAITDITFPRIGSYQLEVTGHSRSGQFKDFVLDYPATVATAVKINSTTARNDRLALGILGTLGLLGIIATVYWLFLKPTR